MSKSTSEEKLLQIYLEEISKYPLLTAEEEKELARKIKEGDKNALKKLVESNLRLVIHFAKKFTTPGISLIDLINEGNLALLKAAKRFDPDKDVKFSTYAKWWIRHALWQVLTQKYPYSLKIKDLVNLFHMERLITKLKDNLGRMPNFEEIKEEFNKEFPLRKNKITLQELKNLYEVSKDSYSLSLQLPENEDITIEDIIESKSIQNPETELVRQSLKKELLNLLEKLSELEKKIIILRFGLGNEKKPLSIADVSKIVGLSKERIRQIEKRAIYKLRKFSQYYRLESFLN